MKKVTQPKFRVLDVEIIENELKFNNKNDKYAKGNYPRSRKGHMAKIHTNTNRRYRTQKGNDNVLLIFHTDTCGKKANHTVRNGR